MEFDTEQGQFLNWFQKLHFHEVIDHGLPAEKAEVLRNMMVQIDYAKHKKFIDEPGARLLMSEYYNKYSTIVDSFDPKEGLNNFAVGALAICSLNKNESQQWETSLTLHNITKLPFLQEALNADKKYGEKLKRESENEVLFTLKNRELETPSVTSITNSSTKSSAPGLTDTTQNQLQVRELNNKEKPANNNRCEKTNSMQQVKPDFYANQRTHPGPRRENIEAKVATEDDASLIRRGVASSGVASMSAGTYGHFDRQPNKIQRTEPPSRKRPFNNEEESHDGPSGENIFRTAKEQMAIENQKKFGRDKGQVSNSSYGNAKKSLGTVRRGPSSKFIPPVMPKDGEDGNCVKSSSSSSKSLDEPQDERLKGIEPKMIEMIMNEIMDHGSIVRWDDVAGLEFAKKTIKEIVVWPMLRPDIFTGLRGPPKGLLLFGPPGTGKTLIGKCIASQSKSTFFSISASSLTSKWVGEGEKMVRAMFAVARCNQPAVIFIDEIDSLLTQRSENEHEASRRIKTEFLVQLDGAATVSEDRILVIGATNRPQEIDEAARRRFVKRLYIPLPEAQARKQIVSNLLQQQSCHVSEEELSHICQRSEGFSGADMACLCREAAMGPIRSIDMGDIENISAEQVRPILFCDFEEAFDHVRPSVSSKDLDLYIDWNQTYGSGSK